MVKRLVDVVVGVVASVVTLPIVVVLMLWSAVSFRARPWFVQERVGRGGRLFRMVKVRSLPTTVGDHIDKYELRQHHTTRFGSFIRRYHLDELPQLWLVASGSMSLVGPRPEMPHLAERFGADQCASRDRFRPGCVGLWQVSEHNDGLMHEHPEYDIVYAANQGLSLDLYLLWRTLLLEVAGKRLQLSSLPRWVLRSVPSNEVARAAADVAS